VEIKESGYWQGAIKECQYHVDGLRGNSMNSPEYHLSELKRYLDVVSEEVPKHIQEMEEAFEEREDICDEWSCGRVHELEDEVNSLEAEVDEWEGAYRRLLKIFEEKKDEETLKIIRDFDPRKGNKE